MKKLKEFFIYPALICGVIFTLYQGVLKNEFSGLDDLMMIEENWDQLSSVSHIYTAFTDDVFHSAQGSYYRPVLILSYIPDAIISASEHPSPRVFFIINIILFSLNGILVFWFFKAFNFSQFYRIIFTLLYVIHPAFTPAVAWVPGRNDTLLTIFALISIWFFIQFIKSIKKGWIIPHLMFFALAMFTKETAIVIPVISLFFLVYWIFDFDTTDQKGWKLFTTSKFWKSVFSLLSQWIRENLLIVIGWITVVFLWVILRTFALPDDPSSFLGVLSHLFNSWKELIILSGVSILPLNFQVFLQISWEYVLLNLVGFILFFTIPVFLKNSTKNLFFGYSWFLLFWLPTSLSSLLNYHRLMLPLVGVALLWVPLSRISQRKFKSITVAACVGLAVLLIFQNLKFQKSYDSPFAFWSNGVQHSPQSTLANNGMGWYYHLQNENDSAFKFYQNVIEIDSTIVNVRLGMALLTEEMGQTQKTDSLIREEFKVTRDTASVHFYLGQIQLERSDTIRALENLKLGYSVSEYSRNARLFYDTLDTSLKNEIIPKFY